MGQKQRCVGNVCDASVWIKAPPQCTSVHDGLLHGLMYTCLIVHRLFFFVVNGWSVFLVTGLFLLSITKRTDFMANKTENAHELKGFSYKRGVGCWNRSLWLRNRNYFLCEWLEIGMRESLCGSLCHFVSRQCRNLYFLIKILLKFLN